MNDILITVGSLIGALGGLEFIKYLLNRKSNARIAEANAFEIQRKAIIEDYNRVQGEVEVLKKKVDELYEKLHDMERERLDLIKENNELKLKLKEAEKHMCIQPDDKCLQRLSPDLKCRLVKILRGEYLEDHPDAILTEEDMMKEIDNEQTKEQNHD